MAGTADHQEDVVSNLLDLQAELRGEARDDAAPAAEDGTDPRPADAVTVATAGLQVRVTPSTASVAERLKAMNERLALLEADLASVTRRIDGVESDPEPSPESPSDADASWRSFLDLQKIVADRLDHR
jgi:hypothetical protein